MLGQAVMDLAPAGVQVHGVDLADGDLSELNGVRAALAPHDPTRVIHCAAYTDVEGCTRDPSRAYLNNAVAAENVARICAELGARMVMISTDYVFDGTKNEPYTEQDLPHPLSAYGESKLAGERLAAAQLEDLLVVRTQWLFGPGGRNFVAAIVERARDGVELRVVADQWGMPTYTRDLAPALWKVALSPQRGIQNLVNCGQAITWADLAERALGAAGLGHVPVAHIATLDWPTPTVRPRYSVLSINHWLSLGNAPLRPWAEAVDDYVANYLADATPAGDLSAA
jgi:dTDP-4-dehydrorhamnose reductase